MKLKHRNIVLAVSVLLMMTSLGLSQNPYLKISLAENSYESIKFPPGTKFKLENADGELVIDDTSIADEFVIDTSHKLTVYPSWKKKTDVFYIEKGKIELIYTPLKMKTKSNKTKGTSYKYDRNKYTNGLSMKKSVERSDLNPNQYNATFKFSNGIVAKYVDGKMTATLEGEKLSVIDKYTIFSKYGVIKLSFRPKSGETWWVFTPKK